MAGQERTRPDVAGDLPQLPPGPNSPESALNPKQSQAVSLLAAGRGPSDVAVTVGVSKTTLWEWQQDAVFEAAYNQERKDLQIALRDCLRAGQLAAVRVLTSTLEDAALDCKHRIAAARALLGTVASPEASPGSTSPEKILKERQRAAAEARGTEVLLDRLSGLIAGQ